MEFGENLANLRKGRGLSIKALSEKSGVAAALISNYEHGKSVPGTINANRLAKALGCSYEALVGK